MSVIFRAKAGIKGSSPTEFKITGEGLANADASVTFDDITMPITKNVTVEPEETQTTPPETDGSNPGTTEPETTTPEENIPEQTTEEEIVPETELEENVTETPTKLPKTGTNMYIPIVGILFILIGFSVYYNKRKKYINKITVVAKKLGDGYIHIIHKRKGGKPQFLTRHR